MVFSTGTDAHHSALAHYGDAVANAEQFREIAADHEDRLYRDGEFVDQLVDLGFGSDVDAAGGLVEEEHVDVMEEQSCDGDFLLITAGEIADGLFGRSAADAEFLNPLAGFLGLFGWIHEKSHSRHGEVVGNAEIDGETFAFSIFAEQTDALGPSPRGRCGADIGAETHLAAFDSVQSENRTKEFGAACADESGDAADLAAMEGQAGVEGFGFAGEMFDFEDQIAGPAGERG